MEPLPTVRADFFGKDKLTFFLGTVEDVNDPKKSGRVRVRCVGWHPKEKQGQESVRTEDLPWAHVCMPTTHAQQAGVGGKHGLLPGCWVIGFFFDGTEAQQPIVLSTFPFTARSTDENNRVVPQGTDGRNATTDVAFSKQLIASPLYPNASRITPSEGGRTPSDPVDPSADHPKSEADDECFGPAANRSLSAERRMNQEFRKEDNGNAEAQTYEVTMADGLCGSIANARDDVRRKIREKLPSQVSRFIYNDAVWNTFTGNYIDLNGLLMQLALEICNLLKQTANASKARREYDENRTKKTNRLMQQGDRDFCTPDQSPRLQQDDETTREDDFMHGVFQTSFIDILCDLIMQILQQINNGNLGDEGNNSGGRVGANPNTGINDWDAACITDTILDTVNSLTEAALDNSREQGRRMAEESNNNAIGAVAGILAGLIGGMFFPLTQRYSQNTEVHNKAGDMSQDRKTKDVGCIEERQYNTSLGALGAGAGGGAGEGGSGTGSGDITRRLTNTGFGGFPGEGTGNSTPIVCEEANTPTFPDTGGRGPGGTDVNRPQAGRAAGQTRPSGTNGDAIAISLPSGQEVCARNYRNGTPNVVIITRPGTRYFYNNELEEKNAYPSINIKGYSASPIPVVEPISGEMVAIITNCNAFSPGAPGAPVSIIPDSNEIGIRTDDPNYDVVIDGFFVANIGRDYCNPTITLIDRDRGGPNGEAKAILREGRIVDVEVINNGTGFRRIPEVVIEDDGRPCGTSGGFGARIYPIMRVVAKNQSVKVPIPQEVVYCPTKFQKNYY